MINVKIKASNLVMNKSQPSINHLGLRRLNLPRRVKIIVPPNQYLVNIGNDLNQS